MVEFEEKIYKKIENVISKEGLDLVNCMVTGRGEYSIIKFLIDKPGGITLDECATISKKISEILDKYEEEIKFNSYQLEVSSPGEDYSLTTVKDFLRKIGKKVVVKYNVENDIKTISGKINKVSNRNLELSIGEEVLTIPIEKIIDGKLKFDL